jgi:hypothetical protein
VNDYRSSWVRLASLAWGVADNLAGGFVLQIMLSQKVRQFGIWVRLTDSTSRRNADDLAGGFVSAIRVPDFSCHLGGWVRSGSFESWLFRLVLPLPRNPRPFLAKTPGRLRTIPFSRMICGIASPVA